MVTSATQAEAFILKSELGQAVGGPVLQSGRQRPRAAGKVFIPRGTAETCLARDAAGSTVNDPAAARGVVIAERGSVGADGAAEFGEAFHGFIALIRFCVAQDGMRFKIRRES